MLTKMNLNLSSNKTWNKISGLICCLWLFAFASNAQSVISFPENQLYLREKVAYHLDSLAPSSFADIQLSDKFTPFASNFINFAYQENGCWLKFTLIAKENTHDLILNIPNPLLDKTILYLNKNNSGWNSLE